jgi:hypothetical protein
MGNFTQFRRDDRERIIGYMPSFSYSRIKMKIC